MTEIYQGVRFKTEFIRHEIPQNKKIEELKYWCKRFSKLGLAPKVGEGSAGNLSFRISNGFIITTSNSDLGNISDNNFTEVIDVDFKNKIIKVAGKKIPSSESMLHYVIYKNRPDINAIFHGHSQELLNSNIISTEQEKSYGTKGLVEEVLKVLDDNKVIIIKNHGFLSLGNTMNQAGNNIIKMIDQ